MNTITYLQNIDAPTLKRKLAAARELLVSDREPECQAEIRAYLEGSPLYDVKGNDLWLVDGARITKIGRKRVTLDLGDEGPAEVDLAAQSEPYRVWLSIR